MDEPREHNREIGLYVLAFGLALVIRLIRLGELPLGDEEARWALQALNLVKGLRPAIGPQPAYVLLTALAFFILQASNFAARLVPAVFGALLTLVPYQFRDRLGVKVAIVLAFFLAFDPGTLALSRLAGSPILAVTAVLFAWGAWRNGRVVTAGVWAGLALLGGPLAWAGLLSLALAWGLLRGFFSRQSAADETGEAADSEKESPPHFQPERRSWVSLAAAAAGTYLILGSFFLLAAGGLSAGLSSIPAYFGGWLTPAGVPASRLLIGLAFYEILAVLLAIAGLVRGILRGAELPITLGIWLLASLVLVLANPSRQVADLAWVLMPLLALAALEASSYFIPVQDGTWETIGMAAFTAALLAFAALNYAAIALVPMEPLAGQLRWGIMFGSLGLLAVSIIMVAYGWSALTAVQGSLWGGLVVMAFYTISMSVASGGLRAVRTFELWPSSAYIGQANTLVSQMNDLSRWKKGVNATLDVAIAGFDSPALLWELRDWPLVVLPEANLSGNTPSVVITPEKTTDAQLAAAYRGEMLNWRVYPAWEQGLPADWLRWSILHDFPTISEKLVLWVRTDVFIDSQNSQ